MKIFIFIPWFYPAYKGGGPIQSITNIITDLNDQYKFYVITSAYDLDSKSTLVSIKPDCWNSINLPGTKTDISVWYINKGSSYQTIADLLSKEKPTIIYLNTIFSYTFFLLPLFLAKQAKFFTKVLICPRGMLQSGALATKKFKKITYLKFLKLTGLLNTVQWHATNVEEKSDILNWIDENSVVEVALNIPKKPISKIALISKEAEQQLSLVYLSLITEKKNLLLLLQALKKTVNITLDIYGPIKDKKYWEQCCLLMDTMPEKVKYLGDIVPVHVQDTISQYHALALFTKGENFGHALYESLSVGRPVITSQFTDWKNLELKEAGWNVDISNIADCVFTLNKVKSLSSTNYSNMCKGAHAIALEFYSNLNAVESYGKLFKV